jgi:hypothetical protein
MDNFEVINSNLLKELPKDQVERVLNQDMVDIEPQFLGFVHIYYHLSQIIPKHWTIVDLGCAYAPQAYYFRNHKTYIGVDIGQHERFQFPNTIICEISIEEFIQKHLPDLNIYETFAICAYVNDNNECRKHFENIFTYYPHGGHNFPCQKGNA